MRYSPDQKHICMERWEPRRIEVCEAATGKALATFPAGQNPRWLDASTVLAESPDGEPWLDSQNGFWLRREPSNRGQLDANGANRWAVSDLRQTQVLGGGGSHLFVPNAREPRISASEMLAVRHPATGALRLVGFGGLNGPELGPCEDSRWSSETLVWWLGGRVWGRTTPDQPTVELTVPGRSCSHPLPFWDAIGGVLYLGLVLDDGELWVSRWGSADGWRVGQSDGSAFDWTMTSRAGGVLMVCYFDPHGTPVYVDVATNAPPQSMLKPPAVDPWALTPDGTHVTDAFRWMFGEQPCLSPDGQRICLHKNVNEQEWREVNEQAGECFHLFDRSRYPGDVGWYLYNPDWSPIWAMDRFRSGERFSFDGEKVEMSNGARVRWQHVNTLYGLKAGGVCVQFDPRFPHQDYGVEKCYERQFNAPTAIRWELWYTPDTPEARALPWGDRSLDVLKQAVESPIGPPNTLPYIECPRLSVTDDPWAVPDQPPNGGDMTTDEAAARAGYPAPSDIVEGAMMRFRNEVILERDKIPPDSMTMGAMRYFNQYYNPAMAEQQVRGGVPGSADGWGHYSQQAFNEAADAYRREQNPQ